MSGEIQAETRAGVRWLRLIGHGERNAMTPTMMRGLGEELRSLAPDVKVVIITGAGKDWFCGGGHVGNVDEMTIEQVRALSVDFVELHRALRRARTPVIAKVDGHVAANGVALVAACDLAVAPAHVEFAMPEINVGLIPLLATAVLVRHLTRKAAFEIAYFGRRFSAETAKTYGLLTRVVPDMTALETQVEEWGRELTERSAAALAIGRATFIAMMNEGIDKDMEIATGNLTALFLSEEVRATLRATGGHAFADKTPPKR